MIDSDAMQLMFYGSDFLVQPSQVGKSTKKSSCQSSEISSPISSYSLKRGLKSLQSGHTPL